MCADAVDCVVVELRCSERQHVLTTYLPPTASGPAAGDVQMASTPAKQPTEVTWCQQHIDSVGCLCRRRNCAARPSLFHRRCTGATSQPGRCAHARHADTHALAAETFYHTSQHRCPCHHRGCAVCTVPSFPPPLDSLTARVNVTGQCWQRQPQCGQSLLFGNVNWSKWIGLQCHSSATAVNKKLSGRGRSRQLQLFTIYRLYVNAIDHCH